MSHRPGLTVLAGPSGVGKGTVARAIVDRHPEVFLAVSATTRPRRPGEVDGVDYFFVDRDWFERALGAGEILESAAYQGNLYGSLRAPVEAALAEGRPALLEIELEGARQVAGSMPGALLVFLEPPSEAELAKRLAERGTEDAATRHRRLERAKEEMAAAGEFDVVIVNDELEQTVRAVESAMGLGSAEG